MARIMSISTGHQDVRPHASQVDCFVQELVGVNGEKLVHISTFGSALRQSQPKSSQSMQFNREMAAELTALFVRSFGRSVLPDAG